MNLLNLLQFSDSALPVGGFAYSYGLEAAVRQGLLTDKENLKLYLRTYANQLISFEFPFVIAAYNLYSSDSTIVMLKALVNDYEAMLLNPVVKKAGVVVGRNWLRLFRHLHNDADEIENLE